MIAWLKRLFRRDDGSWPRHLFVDIKGLGIGYVGEVDDDREASDFAHAIVAHHVMDSGSVAFAHHWTSKKELFTRAERRAFEAATKAAAAEAAPVPELH